MPRLKKRKQFERGIQGRLFALFQAVLNGSLSLDMLTMQFSDVFASQIGDVYNAAFEKMFDANLTSAEQTTDFLGQQYGKQRALKLANDFARNVQDELQRGVEPEVVFSDKRAAGIAVTEVTFAVTTAETSARESNRVGVPQIVGADVPIDDDLIAIWIDSDLSNVCPVCKANDRQPETEWRDQFPFGPPAHPNCNCHLEYVPANQPLDSWLANRK